MLKRAALTLDTARRKASRAGWPLALSRKEFAQLEALLCAERARVANEDLIEQVRDEHTSHQTNAIRVTHSKLRAKLGDRPVIDRPPGSGAASMTGPPDEATAGRGAGAADRAVQRTLDAVRRPADHRGAPAGQARAAATAY